MKKALVISTLIMASIVQAGQVQAKDASTEENVGFASGAITGAAVGGPIGLIIGGMAGVILGGQVEKANDLEAAKLALQQAETRETQLKGELAVVQQGLDFEDNQELDAQWVTNGLTLNLMFTTNSAALSDADTANIIRLAGILKQFPELNLQLDGYSDPRGTQTDNLILSQLRVSNVQQAFEAAGVSADRLIGQAHGEMFEVSGHQDMDAYALARKVSVNFIPQANHQVAQN